MVELIEQIKYNLYFTYSNKNRNSIKDCGIVDLFRKVIYLEYC